MATLPHNDIFQLVREPIDTVALAGVVRAPEDGAVVTFDGFVRNQSHNRPTLYLDYEAYESMALAKMREMAFSSTKNTLSIASPWSTGSGGSRSVTLAYSLPSARRTGPPPLTPAASPSTPSSAPCPSGKRSTSKTARFGRTVNCRPHPRRHRARNLHLNSQCR